MNSKEGVGAARTSSDSNGDTDTARLVNMPNYPNHGPHEDMTIEQCLTYLCVFKAHAKFA